MVRRWVRRAGIFVAVIIILLIGVVLFLHTSAGKSVVRNKVQSFLQEKWKTEVIIRNVDYRLPDWVALEGLTILDREKDTVLNGGRLYVEINLLKLLSNKLDVTSVVLDDISLYCHRGKNDTTFNYQFLLDAFAPASTDTMSNPEVSPMHLTVKELRLKNVRMNYRDQERKLYFSAFIHHLSALPGSLHPEKTEFNLNDFRLHNTHVVLTDSSVSDSNTETNTNNGEPASLLMALGKLDMQNVSFSYQQPFYKIDYRFRVNKLQLRQVVFDLANQVIHVDSLELSRSSACMNSWSPSQTETKKTKEAQPERKNDQWKFAVNAIRLSGNSFVHQNTATPTKSGLDFEHIDAQNINFYANHNSFDSSGFSSDVHSVSLSYNNQLHVKQVRANVRMSEGGLMIRDLATTFNQSELTIDGEVSWPMKPSQFRINDLSVLYGDLLLIQPNLKKLLPLSLRPSDKIKLSGNISGTPRGIKANQLLVSSSGNQFYFKGNVDLKMKKGVGSDITAGIHQLRLKKQLLSKTLLQELREQNIQLPDEVVLMGRAGLNSHKITTDLKLSSAYGQLKIHGHVTNIQDSRQSTYQLALDAQNFETGKWIGLDSVLGKITGRILIDGRGFQLNNMGIKAGLQLRSAVIKNYPYQNLNLLAELNKGAFSLRFNIHDPSLVTEMDMSGRILPDYLVQGNIKIEKADFFKLGFTTDSLQYSGNLTIDGSYVQPNKIDLFLQTDSNRLALNGKQIITDGVIIKANTGADKTEIGFQSSFMDARFAGNYPFDSLAKEISRILRGIKPLQQESLIEKQSGFSTTFEVTIRKDTVLSSFLPQLDLKQPLLFQARFSPLENGIQLTAPSLSFGKFELRDWQANAKTTDSIVQFSLTGRELLMGKKRLEGADISGEMKKGLLRVKALVNDSGGIKYYAAHVQLEKKKDEMTLRFLDDLTLNRNQWTVSPENEIRMMKKGFVIHQLLLESRGQKLFVQTQEQQPLSPIDIRLENFDLGHVFSVLSPGDTLASGMINADFSIRQPMENIPVVTGDIKATDLALFNTFIGNFQFHSKNIGDSLLFEGGLSGVNQLDFNAGLHLKNKGIHLQSHLQKFNMEMVRGFTKDIFAQLSGNVTGELQLEGFLDAPKYKAALYLDSTQFSLVALNTPYRINQQKLLIDHPDLHLENFVITDTAGNQFNISGKLGLFQSGDKAVDLAIETKDFTWLDAKKKPGATIYGKGIIDINLSIKGTVEAPVITGDAYLKKKSAIYLVANTNNKTRKTRSDGIQFVDMDTIGSIHTTIAEPTGDTVLAKKKMKGLKYDLDFKVDKEAQFSIIIDPSTSEELQMIGDARLKAGVADNGKVGIEGVYNLQSGYYKINNLLLRGKFLLVKGSSISFSGDPSMAEADVTTEYVVEASPKGLLNYKEGDDAAYSQRVPFGVIFMIKGPLSKPALSFDIQLKSGKGVLQSSVKSDVEHALDRLRTDVTEMNKQVFSLLLTKRFSVTSSNNSLENSNLNANNALKEGVSSFLTEAMNQVADQLITGVDVEVNMKTYKTDDDPISKTDLGVAVSKDLMEDRLVIRIEENFPMGNSSVPVKSGSQYIPDITSTYKLSKDGRYQLKGYQKNEYDAVVQGYFTEIGISFIIEVSYEKFNEILRRRKNLADEKK